jgi:predicted Rossmann fold nucleotide-binding protein DprA/Smf involved in DNA uptake
VGDAFATDIGRRCAAAGLAVFSGAARGVDRLAMAAALERGGTAVGILADSLERALREADIRRPILSGDLALATPFHPAAGFSVGNAMARNKLIYCLADAAVVVATAVENGGTWAGAIENLRAGWVPLFVRAGSGVPTGNRALIERGAMPLDRDVFPAAAELRAWLGEQIEKWEVAGFEPLKRSARVAASARAQSSAHQRPLFEDV